MLRTFRLLTVALLALSLLWLASANRDASTASAQAASVGKIFVAIDAGEALADAALYSLDADGSNQTKLFGFHGHPADGSGTGLELKSSDGIGITRATNGITYGVFGQSNSPNGYGVYSDGKMHVNGNLSWKAITRTLSLPPAAFVPGIGADSHPHADITSPFIYIPSSPKALTMRRLGFDDPGWGRYISTGGLSSCSQNDMFHFRRW